MAINDESLLGTTARIDVSQARSALESRIAELNTAADVTGEFPVFDSAAIEQQVLKDYIKAGRMGELRTARGSSSFDTDLASAMAAAREAHEAAFQSWRQANVRDLAVIGGGPMMGGGGGFSGGSSGGAGGGGEYWAENLPIAGGGGALTRWSPGFYDSFDNVPEGMPDIDVSGYNSFDVWNYSAPVGPNPPNWWQRNSGRFANPQFRTAAAYAGMHALSAAGAAYADANNGEYRTAEQIDESALGVLPGAFALAGATVGAAAGNPIAGALVGGGVGTGAQQIGSASFEREQAARQAAELLASSLGEASSKAREFTDAIQSSGVATKEFQAGLGVAGSVGSFGPNTQAGLGGLINSFTDTSAADLGAIVSVIKQNPMLAAYGQRLASGNITTSDIQSLEIAAADDGDFGNLHTLQQAAQKSQLKDNTQYQTAQNMMRTAENPAFYGNPLTGPIMAAGGLYGYFKSKSMEGDLAPDAMAPVSNALANTITYLNTEVLGSGSQVGARRGAFQIAGIDGSSLGDIQQAGYDYLEALGGAEVPLEAKADIYRKQVNSAKNDTDRQSALKRLADTEAALNETYLQSAATKRELFADDFDTSVGKYGYGAAQEQLALTRSLLAGGTYSGNAGRMRRITAIEHEKAQYELETADDPGSPLSPAERLQRKASAEQELAQVATQANQFRFAGVQQDVTGLGLGVQSAMIGVQKAGYSEGPDEVYAAAQKAVKALTAEFEYLTKAISGTTDVTQRQQLMGVRNGVQAELLQIEHDSQLNRLTEKARYAEGGATLSDTFAETDRLLHGTSNLSITQTAQAVADANTSKRYWDDIAGNTSLDPLTRQNAQQQSAGIDLQNARRWQSIPDNYAPPPELADKLINDKGALYRMGRTFGLPGDLNAGQLGYFNDLRSELSDLDRAEEAQRKAMGGTLSPDVVAHWDARKNSIKNEMVDAGSDIVNRWAYNLPSISIGGTSFEGRYMPSPADYGREFEGVAAKATDPAVRSIVQSVGVRNFGYTKPSAYDVYNDLMGGHMTAGSDPARSQPGNHSAQVLGGSVDVNINLTVPDLLRGSLQQRIQVPVTNQTRGMDRIMPGAG